MTEPEIDALMAGQEDENGSVHYEGKLFYQHSFTGFYTLFCFSFSVNTIDFFLEDL